MKTKQIISKIDQNTLAYVNRNFGKIKLVPLKEYKVPAEIESIEASTDKEGNDEWVSLFSRLSVESEMNADAYIEKYTTMVYLEEAAQSKFLKQFKTGNIRLERTDDNEFCFENNVNYSIEFFVIQLFTEIFFNFHVFFIQTLHNQRLIHQN